MATDVKVTSNKKDGAIDTDVKYVTRYVDHVNRFSWTICGYIRIKRYGPTDLASEYFNLSHSANIAVRLSMKRERDSRIHIYLESLSRAEIVKDQRISEKCSGCEKNFRKPEPVTTPSYQASVSSYICNKGNIINSTVSSITIPTSSCYITSIDCSKEPYCHATLEDSIKIVCILTEASVHSFRSEIVPWPTDDNHSASACNASLYESRIFSDIEFNVCGTKFKAHKALVATQSPVFGAMFNHDMKENRLGQVDITGIQPSVFENMLYYMYTNKIMDLTDIVKDVYMAADMYDIPGLKNICICKMSRCIDETNVLDTLDYAEERKEEKLRKCAINYLKESISSFIDNPHLKTLISKHPRCAIELISYLLKKSS